MQLSQNEKQLLVIIYALSANKISATKDMISRGGLEFFKNGLLNLETAYSSLIMKELVGKTNDKYTLINQASEIAADRLAEFMQKRFNTGLARFEQSEAFAKFCTELYGRNLGQLNLLTEKQLQLLSASLKAQNPEIVLDLGCGLGKITEFLCEELQTSFIGLDYAEDTIISANERNKDKNNIRFICQDFNELNIPDQSFDAIISIDAIYFTDNLETHLQKLYNILKQNAKLYLFYSSAIDTANLSKAEYAQSTKLAKILTKNNFKYTATDFSVDEFVYWNNVLEVGEPLKPEFAKEGTIDLIDQLLKEAELNLKSNALLRVRFLYIASK